MLVLTGSERARSSPPCVFWYRHTLFYLSVSSESVGHLREHSFPPYGPPKTETQTQITKTSFRYYRRHVYHLSYNYIITNNMYDVALNRPQDLIVGGTSVSS